MFGVKISWLLNLLSPSTSRFALTIQKRKQRAIFFHRKFREKKENERGRQRASGARGLGEGGVGNPREISTRTCNGESAFLADGSDVEDDEEGGGRKIKGGETVRGCKGGEGIKSFPWSDVER